MPETRLQKARKGYEGYVYEPLKPHTSGSFGSEPRVFKHQWWCGGLEPCACTDGWKAVDGWNVIEGEAFTTDRDPGDETRLQSPDQLCDTELPK